MLNPDWGRADWESWAGRWVTLGLQQGEGQAWGCWVVVLECGWVWDVHA